ncbi:MAG: RagB/SusD family nutrient uptake outer membrane protein, partial [Bacteroidales bacterium]|nr:RagB/SusD family nutrient uptake outer membrane protein [Bacteroidales bacterium]
LAIRGDDLDKGSSPTDQADLTSFNNFDYAAASSYWALSGAWGGYYGSIGYYNEAIDAFNEYMANGAPASTMKDYIAQVTVMRAFTYLRISRLWGDIPVYFSNADRVGIKKISHKAAIEKVIADVEAVVGDLSTARPAKATLPGQVTSYTAHAVLAKLAAEILDYDKVLAHTAPIINDYGKAALFQDYHYLFTNQGNLTDEMILEAQCSSRASSATPWNGMGAFQGPGTSITAKVEINGSTEMASGWSFFTPTDKIVNLMKNRGETTRYETTILWAGQDTWYGDHIGDSNPYSDRWNGKFYNPSGLCYTADWGDGNNVRLIRYSDIVLLDAEAKIAKGQNGDQGVNWIRERAGLSAISGVTADQVMEERFVELCFEHGERFYDLVRTGRAEKELSGYSAAKQFYPIPQTVIDATPALAETAE